VPAKPTRPRRVSGLGQNQQPEGDRGDAGATTETARAAQSAEKSRFRQSDRRLAPPFARPGKGMEEPCHWGGARRSPLGRTLPAPEQGQVLLAESTELIGRQMQRAMGEDRGPSHS
jgi:hypothetical protein